MRSFTTVAWQNELWRITNCTHTHTLLRNVNAAPSLANSRTANTATHKHTRAHTVTDYSCRCDYSARFARKPFKPYPRARMREKEREGETAESDKSEQVSKRQLKPANTHANPHREETRTTSILQAEFCPQAVSSFNRRQATFPCTVAVCVFFFVLYRSPCLFIHRHSV